MNELESGDHMSSRALPTRLGGLLDTFGTGAGLVVVAILLAAVLHTPAAEPKPPLDLPDVVTTLDGAKLVGSTKAKVVMVEYADFQCPFCASFARDTLPGIEASYIRKQDVLMAFRELPLDIHPFAKQTAVAAECAYQQGRFWEMYDYLFARQTTLNAAPFPRAAEALALSMAPFNECVGSTSAQDAVAADEASAAALGIKGTPTFVFGRVLGTGEVVLKKELAGARPFADFKRILDVLLSQPAADSLRPSGNNK